MQPTGERRGRGTAAVLALVLGVAVVGLVVLSSAGGSVRPVTESTKSASPRPPLDEDLSASPQPRPRGNGANGEADNTDLPAWLSAVGRAAFWVLIVLVALVIAWRIYAWVRMARIPEVERAAPDIERPKPAARLAEAVETSLLSVESGTATDAVIACWVALEESAAAAGMARRASETSSEFTVRVLSTGISEAELVGLARLYREARYSTHGTTEAAREQARTALIRLRDELATAVRR